jgi:outer membrane murein-binding lipoprotein Lpp
MSLTKLIITTMVFSATLLSSGCSNGTRNKIDQLSSGSATMEQKINRLDSNIDMLSSEMESVKENSHRANDRLSSEMELVNKNAHRANDRLDNQVHSYRK